MRPMRRNGATRPRDRRRQRGIALIAVLWILVVLSLLAANLTQTSRSSRQLARNLSSAAQARALADGGVHVAIAGLLEPDIARRLAIDGTPYRMDLGEGRIFLTLRDERGKIDLNRSPRAVLAALFDAAGADDVDAIVDALLDYRDADENRRPSGAEDNDYQASGLGHCARDGPLETVEELRRVFGVTGTPYDGIADAITVHGGRRVNRASATPFVLSLLPGAGSPMGDPREDDGEASGGGDGDAVEIDGDGALITPATTEDGQPTRRSRRRARRGAVGIRAEGRTSSGVVFVRDAIVRVGVRRRGRDGREALPNEILAWRQGRGGAAAVSE